MVGQKPRERQLLHASKFSNTEVQPNLIDIQLNSFKFFLEEGIKEEFANLGSIAVSGGKYELVFTDKYSLSKGLCETIRWIENNQKLFRDIYNV